MLGRRLQVLSCRERLTLKRMLEPSSTVLPGTGGTTVGGRNMDMVCWMRLNSAYVMTTAVWLRYTMAE